MSRHKHQPFDFGWPRVAVGICIKVKVLVLHGEIRGRYGHASLWIVHLHGLQTVHLGGGGGKAIATGLQVYVLHSYI